MTDSQRLLGEYVANGSETAFRELVSRYVDLVYSVALRLTEGDKHLAEDVAQTVFADFARKAPALSKDVMLGGWLHRHTCFIAARTMRRERRRQVRERQAAEMNMLQDYSEANLALVAPILDEAINKLGEADRKAILLRFFEQQDFRTVGEELGSNEDAARMRVNRALEKLQSLLKHRGVTLSAAVLGTALASEAVTAAPTGLAAGIAGAALAAAAKTGATLTLLKFMAMTKVQFGVTALVLGGAAIVLMVEHKNEMTLREQNDVLQRHIAQLQSEHETFSKRSTQSGNALKLNLPAPRMRTSGSRPNGVPDSTELIARLNRGEKAPTLTPEQAEKFLNENHRSAASLLAAFRATGDQNLLKEAMEKFPGDPQVAFTAAYAPDTSPEDRRRWLDVCKQAAPGNSFADYLSAADHFKAGQTDQAIQDLSAASGKKEYQDYSWDFIQSGTEAYRAAGYSETEARIIPSMSLLLPQFAELKQVNDQMINLAAAYHQAGDESSAQAALQMDLALGQRLTTPANASLLSQLVGLTIESDALRHMDPNSSYDDSGHTVQDQLNQVNQQRTTLREFDQQLQQIYTTISPADWISYHDRWLAFGEDNAIKWLLDKYRQK